jgi:hypothetical protein
MDDGMKLVLFASGASIVLLFTAYLITRFILFPRLGQKWKPEKYAGFTTSGQPPSEADIKAFREREARIIEQHTNGMLGG